MNQWLLEAEFPEGAAVRINEFEVISLQRTVQVSLKGRTGIVGEVWRFPPEEKWQVLCYLDQPVDEASDSEDIYKNMVYVPYDQIEAI